MYVFFWRGFSCFIVNFFFFWICIVNSVWLITMLVSFQNCSSSSNLCNLCCCLLLVVYWSWVVKTTNLSILSVSQLALMIVSWCSSTQQMHFSEKEKEKMRFSCEVRKTNKKLAIIYACRSWGYTSNSAIQRLGPWLHMTSSLCYLVSATSICVSADSCLICLVAYSPCKKHSL